MKIKVQGDHPIMRRPDKTFSGENAKARAETYASVLRDQGYENVKIIHQPSTREGDDNEVS